MGLGKFGVGFGVRAGVGELLGLGVSPEVGARLGLGVGPGVGARLGADERVAPADKGGGVRHAAAVHGSVPSGLAATAAQKPVSYFQPSWLMQRTGRARCPCRRRRTRDEWQRIERNA